MIERLRVLIVEDVEVDAALAERELKRAGIACEVRRVEAAGAYASALQEFQPDLILSDFSMPHFDGMEALAIARRLYPEIPFIFVSGTLGEEYAIRALKSGATDYVLKTNLVRLPAAVERAMQDVRERRARHALERDLKESERRYRELFQSNPHPMWVYEAETLRFLAVNDTAVARYGFSREEFLAMTIKDIRPEAEVPRLLALIAKPMPATSELGIWQHRTKWGDLIDVEISSHDIVFEGGPARIIVAYNITERKRAEEALRESETRLRTIIETEPACVKTVSGQGELLEMNQAGLAMLQAGSLAEAKQQSLLEFIAPEHRAAFTELHKRVMNGESDTLEFEVIGLRGARLWLETHAVPLRNSAGTVQHLLGITHDVTIRRNQEQKLARLTRIYAVLSGINAAIVRIRDRQELFREACRIVVEHGGFTVGWIAVLDRASGRLVSVAHAGLPVEFGLGGESSEDRAGLIPAGAAEVALREKRPAFDNDIVRDPGTANVELGPDTKSVRRAAVRLGAKSVIVLPLFVEGETFGVLTLYAPERDFFDEEEIKLLKELAGDISFGLEFIAKEEKVDYLAYYDVLTGLPNRTLFFDRLAQQLGAATRERLNVALLLLDLDRFRMINDTLGRQAGDALLNAVAQRIKNVTRDQDTVARLGADRFAVAVSGDWQTADFAHVLEARNEALFGQPFLLGQEELRVLATTGIAMFPGDGDDPESLVANAEAALRKAKEQNARFLFYGPEMNARVAESLRLESRLRRALEKGEMVLWYQPKVNVKTRKLTGFEALMRWQDPETGLVPPAKFIPLMEQTGLILEAGRWALSQVARDCRLWGVNRIKLPRVAVNVSPIQLRQKDFVATVVEAAVRMEEAGSMLDLEITETVIMGNVENIIPILQTLRGLGVEIAVDDFGTGYSSLAYIARLPIHDLKIDRSFVVGMTDNQDSLAIVKSVISLAHSLRLKVVAEGVETEEQAALLLKLGCDEMQGFLISQPVPPEEVSPLLR